MANEIGGAMKTFRHHREHGRCRPARRGSALIEFGIVMPLLILIAFGCVDFCRYLYVHMAVTNAAQEGATYGSLNPALTTPGWTDKVKAQAVAEPSGVVPALMASHVTVVTNTPSADPAVPGYVTVKVEYPFTMLAPGVFTYWGLPNTITLRRTVVMPHTR